ncbi:PP2C family serine/threonine-protein phosphatase [Adlercreutzia caecimuris]|uniref:Protein phosphatase 2C domain-containing protein n=1 Tax=Adlercreutzia caecimuris TaxID=671266 RepID=A0A4S4FZY9_9ACTN|nr:PP2C family serine/threonine-protein phosphatase [Adlercreutzia caecimuris]THG35951.1 protein phosphatase 2C domain-containing protein [Adlercreutzia caecimuris]
MGLWSLTSAEVQGSGHKKSGTPCQDKTCCLERNKVRVIALADGAGSARLSHLGAEDAVKCAANLLADEFESLYEESDFKVQQIVASALVRSLGALASKTGCQTKDLSSTLLAVAVKKNRFVALHIGDGVIGCLLRNKLVTLSEPDNGEFAHLTWFTTTSNLEEVVRVYRGDASSISGFILMSDGVEPSLYDGRNSQLADAVINLFYCNAKYPKGEMADMLEQSLQEVIAKRTNDDCSVALLSRTRYKKYGEYAKYRKMIAKRNRRAGNTRR